jgi:hypothetical protein
MATTRSGGVSQGRAFVRAASAVGAKLRALTDDGEEGTAASAAPVADATAKNTLHPQNAPLLHDPIRNRFGC